MASSMNRLRALALNKLTEIACESSLVLARSVVSWVRKHMLEASGLILRRLSGVTSLIIKLWSYS